MTINSPAQAVLVGSCDTVIIYMYVGCRIRDVATPNRHTESLQLNDLRSE